VFTFDASGLIKIEHRYFDTATITAQLGLSKDATSIAALPHGEPTWQVATGSAKELQLVSIGKAIMSALDSKSEREFLDQLSDDLSWTVVAQSLTGGKEISKHSIETIATQLPDATFESRTLFGAGDSIVSEWTMTAPHVTVHALEVMVVKDDKVVSGSLYSNSLEQRR
jgi:ketosteroid isomerase-like protein